MEGRWSELRGILRLLLLPARMLIPPPWSRLSLRLWPVPTPVDRDISFHPLPSSSGDRLHEHTYHEPQAKKVIRYPHLYLLRVFLV